MCLDFAPKFVWKMFLFQEYFSCTLLLKCQGRQVLDTLSSFTLHFGLKHEIIY